MNVKLHIVIDIQTEDDDVDTGQTVEQWNALTSSERSHIVQELWLDMAGADNGGITVTTPGAAEA